MSPKSTALPSGDLNMDNSKARTSKRRGLDVMDWVMD